MFLVKSFIFKCGLACRHPAVCLLPNLVQLGARYTKRKSLASRYISGLRECEAAGLTSLTLAKEMLARVLNELLKACTSKNLDQGVSAALQDLGRHIVRQLIVRG